MFLEVWNGRFLQLNIYYSTSNEFHFFKLQLYNLPFPNNKLKFSRAFNWNPPVIGHLPLLLNSEGTKISKRQNDVRIRDLLEMGIFPNALLNHVTRAGGGFHIEPAKRDLKSFTMDEFVDKVLIFIASFKQHLVIYLLLLLLIIYFSYSR